MQIKYDIGKSSRNEYYFHVNLSKSATFHMLVVPVYHFIPVFTSFTDQFYRSVLRKFYFKFVLVLFFSHSVFELRKDNSS